ncbi:nucleoside recognition domain-containing protein [Paenibacillus sp. B01]|uniref:nucleoside recognition domain-containing protein n=1 Tax=Paenibacillus sp. B01 TaxID=2660554 RepID=UPI00129AFA47|nr:nucleoside recognition domain-containing protein [Paenibacillus sp. B01]QGG55388.1 sporulation integral membrane protein YlbJ [Paenibacillus sp. B01]
MSRKLLHPSTVTALCAALLMALMAFYPASVLASSLRGLSIWWEVLFPALFPFFVLSELMLGLGIVHFAGKLLDPVMRPVFRIPGSGGFVLAMGYLSGYPVGARLASQLWDQKLISRVEGERLVAVTTTSDPIFLIGAVSVGFFHQAAIAPVLAAAHYGSSLAIGFLMRWHGRGESEEGASDPMPHRRNSSARKRGGIGSALKAMHEARLLDGRPFSVLVRDAVQSGLRLMIVVGGLVVVFSVLMELLRETSLLGLLEAGLGLVFEAFGGSASSAAPVISGLFEVTLGAKASSEASLALLHRTALAAWVLSWAGLSVHAQIASLVSHTGMRYRPFLLARFLHGLLAAGMVYALWGWIGPG